MTFAISVVDAYLQSVTIVQPVSMANGSLMRANRATPSLTPDPIAIGICKGESMHKELSDALRSPLNPLKRSCALFSVGEQRVHVGNFRLTYIALWRELVGGSIKNRNFTMPVASVTKHFASDTMSAYTASMSGVGLAKASAGLTKRFVSAAKHIYSACKGLCNACKHSCNRSGHFVSCAKHFCTYATKVVPAATPFYNTKTNGRMVTTLPYAN